MYTPCHITQGVKLLYSNVSTFRVQFEKNYTGQKKFTQAPPVVPVTNVRYVMYFLHKLIFPCRQEIIREAEALGALGNSIKNSALSL